MQYLIFLVLGLTITFTFAKSLPPTRCGSVCLIHCPYGNQVDANGCDTCKCKASPCDNGAPPLRGYFCGRGVNRTDCPSTHFCKISPVDAYAVCCPRTETEAPVQARTNVKAGSCPPPSGLMGICVARCVSDSECPGSQKCCGSCPRTCVNPVL